MKKTVVLALTALILLTGTVALAHGRGYYEGHGRGYYYESSGDRYGPYRYNAPRERAGRYDDRYYREGPRDGYRRGPRGGCCWW